mgnify:CR=1 FL=1
MSVLLSLMMLLSLLPTAVLADESATKTYTKVTSTGEYVMVANNGYAPGVLDGSWVTAVAVTAANDQVIDPTGGVWTLTVDKNGTILSDANGKAIAPKGGNNNGIKSGSYRWAVDFDATDGTFTFAGQGDDTVKLASNASSQNKFRAYKNETITKSPGGSPCHFTLYKLGGGLEQVAAPTGTASGDVKVGDTITLVDGDNRRAEVTITDLTENYVFHYVYITEECYESLFGQTSEINSLMVTYTEDTEENSDAVAEQLIPLSGVSSVSRIESTKNTFIEGMKGVDYAVVVITVSAAALAFVVLFNLTNINITERMRELATLKVLGFYDGELSAYIYRENVILTVFGVALGMGMGKLLHQWLVLTVEIDLLMFGRTLALSSYLYAGVLTAVFSLVVNLAAHRKLKKLDMVESLKTVE